MRHRAGVLSLTLVVSSLSFSGCSTSFAPGPEVPVQTAFGDIGGYVHGGQQPIVSATIRAYGSNTSAYGGASSLLATTTTNAYGYFTFPKTTTCTSGTVVYFYSLGGQPTTGVTNASAGLMAVLGTCPADGLLVNTVTTGTSAQIFINEVSTIAAAYALAGFATNATSIGAPSATDALAKTGLQNAGANASQMYTVVATSGGGAGNNGSERAALATTPNGNGTVPQKQLDTLANILAACINSASPFTPCNTLFADAKSSGGSTGTAATDTATAAIYIAQHPYSANITALYNLVGSTANPFTPALTTAPHDFTVEIAFTGGGLGFSSTNRHPVAIDAMGNAWAVSGKSILSKFSPLGVPATSTGYTENFIYPESLAIDLTGNIWAYDFESNGFVGSLYKISPAGAPVGTYTDTIDGPTDVVVDGEGNVWLPQESNSIVEYNNSGTFLLRVNYPGTTLIPYSVAFEPGATGNFWVADEEQMGAETYTHSGGTVSGPPFANTVDRPLDVAIDAGGNVWFTNENGTMTKLTSAGGVVAGSPYTTGSTELYQLAIDGAGNVWATDQSSAVREFSNSGAMLSSAAGFTPSSTCEPNGIAIDGSGDVWYDTQSDATLREIIGAATPVATPTAYGVANSKLGTRP